MNIRTAIATAAAICGFASAPITHAYDAETHALITISAYQQSDLVQVGPGSVLSRLGLDRLDQLLPFDAYWVSPHPDDDPVYYDNILPTDPDQYPSVSEYVRWPDIYENCQLQHLANAHWIPQTDPMMDVTGSVANLPIENWIVRGVLREDDLSTLMNNATKTNCNTYRPDPDPYGTITRVLNHFYDPRYDRELRPGNPGCLLGPNQRCTKSVDWALGYVNSFASPLQIDVNRRNHFSYVDARANMWLALTGERGRVLPPYPYTADARASDSRERLYRWATTFRALGDVVHMLEDGASPQHVRNDPHSGINSAEQQEFEGYTNARVLNDSALAQAYLRGFYVSDNLIPLPPIDLGHYHAPMFTTPIRFYTTRQAGEGPTVSPDSRQGLMDYSNRSFFTGGTMPGMSRNDFDRPPTPVDTSQQYVRSDVPCYMSAELAFKGRMNAICTHWLHDVPDSVDPSYSDVLPQDGNHSNLFQKPPLAAESAFNFVHAFMAIPVTGREYAVGVEELQNMGNLTIPRAIGYSAGLINYFFRGQFTLSSPPDGLYAVLDQGTPHIVQDGIPVLDDGSNSTFGFNAVRVRVKNATPDITEPRATTAVPQTVGGRTGGTYGGGTIVAIARYHRNPCYQPDLSGENIVEYNLDGTPKSPRVPSGCTLQDTRSNVPEISVSAPIPIGPGGSLPDPVPGAPSPCANIGNLNSGVDSTYPDCVNTSALLEFDFSADPIPINATDLFLQVAFRGALGDEQDGIAVGSIDIIEPQYYTSWNNTDWYLYQDQWYLPENVPDPPGPDLATAEDITEESICFGAQRILHLQSPAILPPAKFIRLAFLTDGDQPSIGGVATYGDVSDTTSTDAPEPAFPRQSDKDNGGTFTSHPLYYGRGTTLGFDLSNFFFVYTNLPWVYDFPHVAALSPALGGSNPGIPNQVNVAFTSRPDQFCTDHFPDFQVEGAARIARVRKTAPVTTTNSALHGGGLRSQQQ